MKPLLHALLPRPAHPTRDGGAIRMHFLLAALAREFRVLALVLRSPEGPAGEYPAGVEVREIAHSRGALRRATAAARSLAGQEAYSGLLYGSAELARRAAEAVLRERPAWVVALSYHLGALAARQGPASWVDFQNVDSEIWTRIGQTASTAPTRWFARGQAPRVRSLERRVLAAARGVSCVSERDARTLAALSPGARPLVVRNGVDLSRFRFRAEPAAGKILFFVGDLSWPPNAEGIRWFRRRVWPLVRQRQPEARAEVLGRGAPADRHGAGEGGFRFLGEGSDTRPYWERAAVAVVPLLAGGGTRLKILEAAACGVPVVSTPVGAEGLELEPEVEIAIAEEPAAFAEAAARLLADPEARRRQAAAARRKVEALYDWGPIGAAFARELGRRSAAA
ncbi:MAG: glycosyltransferase [Thermoanaerobaculia bacterium]